MKTATKISPENIEIIEKKIGYTFKNKKILQRAFMHSTMANDLNVESNERLEFFGDELRSPSAVAITDKHFYDIGKGAEKRGRTAEERLERIRYRRLCRRGDILAVI